MIKHDLLFLYKTLNPFSCKDLVIEATNICNFKCKFCWTLTMQRKKEHMSLETLDKVLERAKRMRFKSISLSYGGESFLNPDIMEFIKRIKARGFECELTTNGSLLNEGKILQLNVLGIDRVIVSFHATNRLSFNDYTQSKMYGQVLKNVDLLIGYLGEERVLVNYYNKNIDVNKHPLKDKIPVFNSGEIIDLNKKTTKRTLPCQLLNNPVVIRSNGDISLGCCFDSEGYFSIGNVYKNSFLKAIFSKKSLTFKYYHLRKRFNKVYKCVNCPNLVGG